MSARPQPPLDRGPPADLLLHPVTLAALALLVLNDGWLRSRFPGVITGKLSDVAALIVYPAVLCTLAGLAGLAGARLARLRGVTIDPSLGPGVLILSLALTGITFTAINLSPAWRDRWLDLLGLLDPGSWWGRRHYTVDPTDLLTLPALLVPAGLGRQALRRLPTGRLRAAAAAARHAPDPVLAARRVLGRGAGRLSPDAAAALDALARALADGALDARDPARYSELATRLGAYRAAVGEGRR